MKRFEIHIPEIPHGHGLSFKRGLADGVLDVKTNQELPHPTHAASYVKGNELGKSLIALIAEQVKA